MKGKGFGKVEAFPPGEFPDVQNTKTRNKKFFDDWRDATEYVKILQDNGATDDEISTLLEVKGFEDGKEMLKIAKERLQSMGGKKKRGGKSSSSSKKKKSKKKGGRKNTKKRSKTKKKRSKIKK